MSLALPTRPSSRTSRVRTPVLPRTATAAACLALACGCLSACGSPVPVTAGPSATSSPTAAPEHPSPSGTEGSTANDPYPGAALWSFPAHPDGWTLQVRDVDGVNQLVNASSCTFTSKQNLFEVTTYGDRAESEYQAKVWTQELASTYGTVEQTTSVSTDIRSDAPEGHTEFMMADATYTDNGTPVRSTTWVRVFTSNQTPTVNSLTYTCPTDAYNESERDSLLKATSLHSSGPSDIDEGQPSEPGSTSTNQT